MCRLLLLLLQLAYRTSFTQGMSGCSTAHLCKEALLIGTASNEGCIPARYDELTSQIADYAVVNV